MHTLPDVWSMGERGEGGGGGGGKHESGSGRVFYNVCTHRIRIWPIVDVIRPSSPSGP